MVPLTALLVPRFAIFRRLGLIDTYAPLVAPALLGASPFYVLLYYAAFRRLPADLFDAAGSRDSPLGIWRRVAMPLVRPVTVAVAVLAFVFTWGNFLDPLVYLYDRDLFTLPLALKSLAAARPDELPGAARRRGGRDGAGRRRLPARAALFEPHRGAGWLGR